METTSVNITVTLQIKNSNAEEQKNLNSEQIIQEYRAKKIEFDRISYIYIYIYIYTYR